MKALIVAALATSAMIASAQEPSKNDNPGSLWHQGATDYLRDRTARKEGDVLTIIINEVSSTSFTASTKTAKNDSTSIAKGIGPILRNLIPNLGIGANSSTAGSGSTSQTGTFVGQMTVIVKRVLPNNTLEIEGLRSIVTNKDTQNLKLTGIVRREDIRPDNTVLSSNIANAQIKAEGKGQIMDRQRRGILSRLLDWLF